MLLFVMLMINWSYEFGKLWSKSLAHSFSTILKCDIVSWENNNVFRLF